MMPLLKMAMLADVTTSHLSADRGIIEAFEYVEYCVL